MAGRPATIDRRERLLQAGSEAFSKESYEQVSTERVAERAGVAQGLLFHYFGTKRAFYVEVNRRVLTSLRGAFETNDHKDPVRWLRAEIDIFLFGLLEHPPDQMTAGIGLVTELRELVDEQERWGVRRILDRMGIDQPSPLLGVAMRGWMAFAIATGRHWLTTPSVTRPQARDLIIDALNRTLAHVADADPPSHVDAHFFLPR